MYLIIFILVLSLTYSIYLSILLQCTNTEIDKAQKKENVDLLDYDVEEIPNFLTSEECDSIIELSKDKLFPSRVYTDESDVHDTKSRISSQCWLTDDNHPIIEKISQKVYDYTGTHGNHQEQLQVVNYNKGGFFTPHYDACDGNVEFCKRMNDSHGPRLLTFLIYLNDEYTGGGTTFPHINKTVTPEKGKAVLFYNVDKNGHIINQAFHGGNPVEHGNKWIANKWIRIN